jgi:hypothetical protein
MSRPFQPSRLDPGSKIFVRLFAQANHKLQFGEGAQKAKADFGRGAPRGELNAPAWSY